MEEVEKEMALAHGGWVSNGGCWKPTECKARVKVWYLSKFRFFFVIRVTINLNFKSFLDFALCKV